ncbi:hypothetical protein [Kocuria kalidii]|uniref:hypothetical protein n=1 Tax=Kocuria kalidii TaxID=3376283 RepID=UPI0037A908E0
MDRYEEPADRDEAYAATSQDDLGVRDENWLTASTDEDNRREDDRPESTADRTVPPEITDTGRTGGDGQDG